MDDGVKVGLALSGGGAKGAYQAGMVKALAEFGVPVQEVAGTSVGALNGAVLACASSVADGARQLQELWLEQAPFHLRLMRKLMAEDKVWQAMVSRAEALGLLSTRGVLVNLDAHEPLRDLLNACCSAEALAQGLPLHVSVYESWGRVGDLLRLMRAELGFVDTSQSKFMHLQALPEEEQMECLLASAALPLLFAPRKVQGKHYTDGAQGGWQTRQGNTPVAPLIDAGCNLVVVMHAGEGSPWDRRRYRDTTFIEIRPRHKPSSNPLTDLLETNRQVLSSWMDQGYEDACDTLGRVWSALRARHELRRSAQEVAAAERIRLEAERKGRSSGRKLTDALEDFKRRI